MDIVRYAEAADFAPPNHQDVDARRLQGGDASSADFASAAVAHWKPGATAMMEAAPIGKIYVIIEGELVVEQADGVRHRLGALDSIFIPAGRARAVLNESGAPAAMIVITPAPTA